MNAQHASDEVTDLIASIEMHRQEIERESGLDASRNYAMPRLQELLKTEQDASQQPGADGPHHAANIEAVNAAIRKVQSLGRGGGGGQQHRGPGGKPQGQFRGPRREGGGAQGQPGRPGHGQPRHRGRRQQARRGGGGGGGGGGAGGNR